MNILQLRQEQLALPFEYFKGMHVLGKEDKPVVTDHQDRYLIVPTDMYIQDQSDGVPTNLYNAFLQMSKAKGFTHLMLIYV